MDTMSAEPHLSQADREKDLRAQLEVARDRIAALERLIRQERAQYLSEQRRAAAEMDRLERQGPGGEMAEKLAAARQEIKELSRYKRQVQRLEGSPVYGPAHRLWRRFKAIRGYEQKVG
jgi:hypothetical protein